MQTYFSIVGGLALELTLISLFFPQAVLWLILKCMKNCMDNSGLYILQYKSTENMSNIN